MFWKRRNLRYLVHFTMKPAESFKVQQLLGSIGISFKFEILSSCMLLKVKEEDVALAKETIARNPVGIHNRQ